MKRHLLLSILFSFAVFNSKAQFLNCVESSYIDLSVICPAVVDSVWGCNDSCYVNECIAFNHFGVTHYTFDLCGDLAPACHADFYTSQAAGPVDFTDSGMVYAFNPVYLIDFGDGNTDVTIPTAHTYATSGLYKVCLTLYDTDAGGNIQCESKTCRYIVAQGGSGCTALFTATTNCGVTTFADLSTGTYNTVQWDFGDGTTGTTNPGDTTYEYAASGTYFVSMNILDGTGLCNAGFTDSITVTIPTVTAGFSYIASGNSSHTVTFTNTSTGATSYYWDLGDGDTSSNANPAHDYDSCSYTVTLTAIDADGCLATTTMLIDACNIGAPVINSVLNSLSVYPNPAKENISLAMNSKLAGDVVITVKDVTGRDVIEATTVHLNSGKNNYNLKLPLLPAGVYLVQVNDDFGMMNTRVLVR